MSTKASECQPLTGGGGATAPANYGLTIDTTTTPGATAAVACEHDECASPALPLTNEKEREFQALRIAIVFCFCFMLAEIVGGYVAHSLAILTDAAHLLTDVGAFGLSLFAIHVTRRGSTHTYSYGFHRAEVLGTLASVFTIWALVGAIVVEAIGRFRTMTRCAEAREMMLAAAAAAEAEAQRAATKGGHHAAPAVTTLIPLITECVAVDSFTMVAIGVLGLAVNLISAAILSWGGSHGHSHSFGAHGGDGDDHHGHSHGHDDHGHDDHDHGHDDHGHDDHGHGHDDHGHDHACGGHDDENDHDDHGHSHGHDGDDHHGHAHHGGGHGDEGNDHHVGACGHHSTGGSMAINAAFLHALGDSVQSLGVVLAGLFIYYSNLRVHGHPTDPYSYYNLADPACSLLFAIVTLFTTRGIIRQLVQILMESTPDGVDYPLIRRELMRLPTVEAVHDLHIWSLTAGMAALSVHIVAADHAKVLEMAQQVCRRHNIQHCTIQVDPLGKGEACATSMGCHNC